MLGFFAITRDTSVATGYGERVNNLGLMSEKQNLLILASTIAIVGTLLFLRGGPTTHTMPARTDRSCPYCAETIKSSAVICRFCNRDVQPTAANEAEASIPDDPEAPTVKCNKCGKQIREDKAKLFLRRQWCSSCFEQAIG